MSQQQEVFSGRYEMVRHVARGGMAQVYLAKDIWLDRPVALKVLFPELSVDESFVERFRREAQAAANLSHPNIVSIYDWGQGERTYFIVMEYVDGYTLSSLIRELPLEPARAAAIGADVAAALEFAHRHGVIHRDVKPGNVLIDRSGQVKVADFGIARAVGASEGLTQTGAVMGTATYFSPEQAQGFPVDGRSDVYSLGVVLYEMVAGRAPFVGDNPVAIAYKHVREAPPPLSQLVPNLPRAFESITMKALAKDPNERYQSAEDLRADLLRFARGQGVLAEEYLATSLNTAVAGPTAALGATQVAQRVNATSALPNATLVETEDEEEITSRHHGLLAVLSVLLVAALAVLIYFGGKDLRLWGADRALPVPTVAGRSASAAMAELRHKGFHNVTESSRPSSRWAKDKAIGTIPASGSRVTTTRHIVLLVSSGPPAVKVDSVAGDPESQALAALKSEGLNPVVHHRHSNSVTTGDVISTSPTAGQPLKRGSAVEVYVSSGKQKVTIPSLTGHSPGTAGSKLTRLGLNVTGDVSESSSSVPAGEVVRTSPPANASVDIGSSVTIYVSSGPPKAVVPNLSGQTESQAQASLQAAGLSGNFTPQTVTSPSQNGVVVGQSPSSGISVKSGSTVTVDIGSYTAPSTTTTVPPTSTTTTVPPSSSTSSSTTTTTTSKSGSSGVAISGTALPGSGSPPSPSG